MLAPQNPVGPRKSRRVFLKKPTSRWPEHVSSWFDPLSPFGAKATTREDSTGSVARKAGTAPPGRVWIRFVAAPADGWLWSLTLGSFASSSRSPSSALLPFFGGRVPLLRNKRPEKSWYPYSILSTGVPLTFNMFM